MVRVLATLMAVLFSVAAHASTLTISVYETGGDVFFSGSGSFDLTGLGAPSPATPSTVARSQFNLFTGGVNGVAVDIYELSVSFTPMNGGGFLFSSVSGDPLLVQAGGFLAVESGYASDDPLGFLWTVSGQTIAGLSLNFGTLATFGSNTVVLEQGAAPSAVPLPASAVLVLSALGGLALFRRRRAAV